MSTVCAAAHIWAVDSWQHGIDDGGCGGGGSGSSGGSDGSDGSDGSSGSSGCGGVYTSADAQIFVLLNSKHIFAKTFVSFEYADLSALNSSSVAANTRVNKLLMLSALTIRIWSKKKKKSYSSSRQQSDNSLQLLECCFLK